MKNTSFLRKVVYLVLMAALLVPLYLVSAPSFQDEFGNVTEGGKLTQLRTLHGLSQSNLGEIDPASESMKLATLGMRGVAANLLWSRANEYKKKEEWDNLRATLNQIAKLQPNFITVWSFQAWNLSYNVSVEFDNYEHRYHWVKKGIEFLMQGTRYNTNEPRLLWDLGWFFGHKFGRSDEYRQFRRKYNTDEDFHESLADKINVSAAMDYKNQPDNWLTAHQWFNEAQDVVDQRGVPIVGKNPLVFHSDSAKSLIRYADAIEEEGQFEDIARIAWERAYARWIKYGDREIPTSYGYKIRLNEGERWNERVANFEQELADLIPGLKDKLREERIAKLSADERAMLDREKGELGDQEYDVRISAEEKIEILPADLVVAVEDPVTRRQVKLLTARIAEAKAYSTTIRRYRDVVNFLYWRTRCEVEQQERALQGRQYLWEADELYQETDLLGSKEKYDAAWKRWASIHNDYKILAEDVTAEDLVDAIKKYEKLLNQLDEDFPPPEFPLLQLVANYAEEFGLSQAEADALLAEAERMQQQTTEAAIEPPSDVAPTDADGDAADDTDQNTEADPSSGEAKIDHLSAARDAARDAEESFNKADLAAAEQHYVAAWNDWQQTIDGDVELSDDDIKDLIKAIRNYRILLGQLDKPFPSADFPLIDFVKAHAEDFGYSSEDVENF